MSELAAAAKLRTDTRQGVLTGHAADGLFVTSLVPSAAPIPTARGCS